MWTCEFVTMEVEEMRKVCFFASILFASANVFGMYNNEASSSKNTNSKRVMPYNQEFIQNKKPITSVNIFNKSSENELKKSFSDDMEVEENNPEKNNSFGCENDDLKKPKEYSFLDFYVNMGISAHNRYTKGDLKTIYDLDPKSKSRVIDAAIQGYIHILQMWNPNIKGHELSKLNNTIYNDIRRFEKQMEKENFFYLFSKCRYMLGLWGTDDSLIFTCPNAFLEKKAIVYTEKICEVLQLDENRKQQLYADIKDFCNKWFKANEMNQIMQGCMHILQRWYSNMKEQELQQLEKAVSEDLNRINEENGLWTRHCPPYSTRISEELYPLYIILSQYFSGVYHRTRHNEEETVKIQDSIKDFVEKYDSSANAETLVREWFMSVNPDLDMNYCNHPETFIRELFESIMDPRWSVRKLDNYGVKY